MHIDDVLFLLKTINYYRNHLVLCNIYSETKQLRTKNKDTWFSRNVSVVTYVYHMEFTVKWEALNVLRFQNLNLYRMEASKNNNWFELIWLSMNCVLWNVLLQIFAIWGIWTIVYFSTYYYSQYLHTLVITIWLKVIRNKSLIPVCYCLANFRNSWLYDFIFYAYCWHISS